MRTSSESMCTSSESLSIHPAQPAPFRIKELQWQKTLYIRKTLLASHTWDLGKITVRRVCSLWVLATPCCSSLYLTLGIRFRESHKPPHQPCTSQASLRCCSGHRKRLNTPDIRALGNTVRTVNILSVKSFVSMLFQKALQSDEMHWLLPSNVLTPLFVLQGTSSPFYM